MLAFKPIDFDAHAGLCVRFAIDIHMLGFGSAERFHESDGRGAERHIAQLRQRAARSPGYLVHVWRAGQVIGQVLMGRVQGEPTVGYISLLYLVPEVRGQGLGTVLQAYAWQFLAQQGCDTLRLSASPANIGAWRFYQRNGWQNLGPRLDAPYVHLLEHRPVQPTVGSPQVINPDDYLETARGRVFTPERNRQAWEACWAALRSALSQALPGAHLCVVVGVQGSGKSYWVNHNLGRLGPRAIVLEAALPARGHRLKPVEMAAAFAVPAAATFVHTPLPLALQRNAQRSADQRVPEAAVRSVHSLLAPPQQDEGFAWIETVLPQPMAAASEGAG